MLVTQKNEDSACTDLSFCHQKVDIVYKYMLLHREIEAILYLQRVTNQAVQ